MVSSAEEVSFRSSALCDSVDTCLQRASDGMTVLAKQQRQRCEALVKEAAALQAEANCVTEVNASCDPYSWQSLIKLELITCNYFRDKLPDFFYLFNFIGRTVISESSLLTIKLK